MWIAILILLIAPLAHSVSGEPEFVHLPAGRLDSQVGVSPARPADPSFGFAYYGVAQVSENAFLAQGEFGSDSYRLGFQSSFLMMDSIYRRSYSEAAGAYIWQGLAVGLGYGFSMEWVPILSDQWTRHLVKVGTSFRRGCFSLGGVLESWTEELLSVDYVVGLHLDGNRFGSFVEFDGTSVELGSRFRFAFLEFLSSYRFPGFGVSVSLVLRFDAFEIGSYYGFSNESLEWFGGGFRKNLNKKTIL
ncbi:MAG: hypothetical protein MJZ26_07720 [Fibrobacter sp.]|nr:hypothetical protein [Fibrobacter sp.]